jgi:DNA polymerase-3 subunit beta
LTSAFQTVSGVVPARTPRDILRNIKLVVADRRATLIGTDQEVGIRCQLPEVITDSTGESLLPTQRMSAILRELQAEEVALEAGEGCLWVRGGQSEFRLSTEDPAEFPDVEPFTGENYHSVSGRSLRRLIQRTLFATDVESTRYALGGILLDLKADRITLAATDSRRLAVDWTTCSAEGSQREEQGQPVLPSKAMSLIERSIRDEEDVRIHVRNNDALVQIGSTTVYTRLVEGRFPKYEDVIPREYRVTIELLVAPFFAAVRQSMIITDDESRGVDFTFAGGTLRLSSQASNVGSSQIELPVSYDGPELVITFDPRFVADFLKVLDPTSQISLNLVDDNSAAVFKADENYTYVVMPLAR